MNSLFVFWRYDLKFPAKGAKVSQRAQSRVSRFADFACPPRPLRERTPAKGAEVVKESFYIIQNPYFLSEFTFNAS